MSTTQVLLDKTDQLVRRKKGVKRDRVYIEALFYGLVCCLVAGTLWQGGVLAINTFYISITYAIIMVLSILVAAVVGSLLKVEAMETLIEVDRALDSKERLSTAYEFADKSMDNIYLPLLIKDANATVSGVQAEKVFPRSYPGKFKYIPFLAAGVILMTVLNFNFDFRFGSPFDSGVRAEGEKIERFGQQLEKKSRNNKLNLSLGASNQMQELGRNLRDQRMERREAEERIADLSERLRGQQEDLRRQMAQRGVDGRDAERILNQNQDFESQLQDLMNQMSAENPSPQQRRETERGLNQLRDQNQTHRQGLSEALDSLQSGDSERARQILEGVQSDQDNLQDLAGLQSAQDALDRSQQALGENDGTNPGENPGENQENSGEEGDPSQGQASAGNPGDGSGGEEEMFGFNEEGSGSRPGTQPVADRPGEAGELETGSDQASKVKGQIDLEKGEIRRNLVRSLPLKTKSGVAEEDLIVDFQRRAEEVMVKEDIPLNFREYIRNYFLLIGVIEGGQ